MTRETAGAIPIVLAGSGVTATMLLQPVTEMAWYMPYKHIRISAGTAM